MSAFFGFVAAGPSEGADDARYVQKAGDTMTGKLIISGVTNDTSLSIIGATHTGSDASTDLSIASTWNTSGVITALKVNVTNTASGVGSKIADFQLGGVSIFFVGPTGATVNIPSGSGGQNDFQVIDSSAVRFYAGTTGIWSMAGYSDGTGNNLGFSGNSCFLAGTTNFRANGGGAVAATINGNTGAAVLLNLTTDKGATAAAGTWKFGALRTSTGLLPSTTQVLQVDVGGTLYSLLLCSTNP